MTVAVEEAQVLQILRDFLEESGRAESLRALEKSTGTGPPGLPPRLACIRELVLNGNWVELLESLQLLSSLGDGEGFMRCQYAVAKQRYLETLSKNWLGESGDGEIVSALPQNCEIAATEGKRRDNERLQVLMTCLEQLEQLCPSKEDYSTLCSLVTYPSLTAHHDYSNWNVYQSRLDCFYTLSEWVGEVLYPHTTLNLPSKGSIFLSTNRLIQLMAKGLLYEECEAMCTHKSQEGNGESPLEVLDLCSWMQHQPDSAFQFIPSKLKVVVIPHIDMSKIPSGKVLQLSKSVSMAPESLKEKTVLTKQPLVSHSVPELHAYNEERSASPKEQQPTKAERTVGRELHSQEKERSSVDRAEPEQLSKQTEYTDRPLLTVRQSDEVQQEGGLKNKQGLCNGPCVKDISKHHSHDIHGFEDNFAPYNPTATLFQTTPLVHRSRGGRESSTPKKPPGFGPTFHSSPATSPVPYVPGTHGISDTPLKLTKAPPVKDKLARGSDVPVGEVGDALLDGAQDSARKHFTFTQQVDHTHDVQWPTATLLTTVTDPQVVRSVAFSHSGDVVAVGANSKTLRLCSTLPLVEEKTIDNELAVFYHHPRYHKGSIYCLAWLNDSLLASGSNDQTIKLLSYSSSSSPCIPQGQLSVHNGTVRDLVFLPDGHLLSGGAGDSTLKLSDVHTGRLIHSLVGHTDQILSVDIVSDTVVASGGQDKTVRLWDKRHTRCFHTITTPHPVASLSTFSNHLATSQVDGTCSVHDLQMLKTVGTFHPHSDECRTVRYSPSGQWLLTGSYDKTVCVADASSLEWREVGRHEDKVIQCRWHSGGRLLVSTGADKKACFWKLNC